MIETLPMPFKTRETVAVETPASFATSLTVHGRLPPSSGSGIIFSIVLDEAFIFVSRCRKYELPILATTIASETQLV
jgi:hypothetical protein